MRPGEPAALAELAAPVSRGSDPEALIREARRRQRRRYALTGLALAMVLAAIGIGFGLQGAGGAGGGVRHPRSVSRQPPPSSQGQLPKAPPIPHSVGTTILIWDGQQAPVLDNLSTGQARPGRVIDISVGDYDNNLLQSGHWIIWVGNGATAIRDDLSGRPRVVAKTPQFAPAAKPGYLWLLYRSGKRWAYARTVRLASIATGRLGPRVTLPSRTWPLRGTKAGLLLAGDRGGLELWKPGFAPRPVPFSGSMDHIFGATASLVAYGTGCHEIRTSRNAKYDANMDYPACRMLRLLDVVTGQVTSVAKPPATHGWVPSSINMASMTSESTMIAAPAAIGIPQSGRGQLYVVRIDSRRHRPVPVPESAGPAVTRWAWSAHGGWLFYQGPGARLWAYQVRTGQVRSSAVPCCQYGVMYPFASAGSQRSR